MVSNAIGFPLIAFGCGALLVCAVSPQLPFARVAIPGVAFGASIAYSVYLSHKLVIHAVQNFCDAHGLTRSAPPAYLVVWLAIALGGSALYFAVERPFLIIRERRPTK